MTVGAVDDPAEVEAERIANEVVQRLSSSDTSEDTSTSTVRRSTPAAGPAIGAEGGAISSDLEASISSARGSGRVLDRAARDRLEPAFGAGLGHVRVHADGRADKLNQSLGARAFTTGNDIFFSRGEYRPNTDAGMHVLAHEVTHTIQQSPPTARRSTIRRLVYNQNPTTWGAPAALNRKRSDEGAAGVYFANDAGPIFAAGTVVIKPLHSSGEITFADQFLQQGMGFDTPNEATYEKTSPEGVALQNVLTAPGMVTNKPHPADAQQQLAGANQIMVMSMVEGKSLQTMSDNEGVEFLQNAAALKQVGHLMVSDAFLGNQDRLVGLGNVNLGNFFYAAAGALHNGKITTIDNDSSFQAATFQANGSLGGELQSKVFFIDQLCTANGKNMFINRFLTRMRGAHQNNANTLAEINANPGWISHQISTGIDDGLHDIATVFANNMDLVRAVGEIADPYSAQARQVSEAKAMAHYIRERDKGTDPATALNKLTNYVEYRTMRNKFPKGTKWLTKVGMKRGF